MSSAGSVEHRLLESQLPMRPLFVVPLALLLWIVPMVSIMRGARFGMALFSIGTVAFMALLLFWLDRAVGYMAALSNDKARRAEQLTNIRWLVAWIAVWIAYVALYSIGLKSFISQLPFHGLLEPGSPILGVITMISILAIYWICARILCEEEEGNQSNFSRIFGTFLLIFYFPFGVPFIYRRLKRLTV